MPRFEPSIVDALKILPEVLISSARGERKLDEALLTPSANLLLGLVKILVSNGTSLAEIVSALSGQQASADGHVASELRNFFDSEFIATARVLCVTTNHSNEAMWANYTENHKGCVLGFRHIATLSTPLLAAKKVVYSKQLPVVGSGIDFLLYGNTKELRESTIDAVCFTKKSAWLYEQEWRAVTWRPEEGESQFGDYKFYPDELESVTLGIKASAQTEATVMQLLKRMYQNCKLFRLASVHGETSRMPVNIAGTQ